MKKSFTTLAVMVSILSAQAAQWVALPDSNFGKWLSSSGYTSCLQGNSTVGWQLDTTCFSVMNNTSMNCSNKGIKNLTGISYFDRLATLICTGNALTSLPSLPNTITYLDCSFNALTSLPPLPTGLTRLNAESNQINVLPPVPNTLTYLNAYNNNFVSLPTLPMTLTYLHVLGNNLTSLPEFPDSMSYCNLGGNPLTCLPRLKRALIFRYVGTNVTCLPNRGNVTTSDPIVDSMPICDIFNEHGCDVLWNISGHVYFDTDTNCVYDSIDYHQANIKVRLWNGNDLVSETYSDYNGFYSFDTDSFSNYKITTDTLGDPFAVRCPANGLHTLSLIAADSLQYNKDFGLDCEGHVDLAAWSINGRFRVGDTSLVMLHAGDRAGFNGAHCASAGSGYVRAVISGPAHYVSSDSGALTPSSISGDTILWNIANLDTIHFFSDFNIHVQTDTTTPIGALVCLTLTIESDSAMEDLSNNTMTQCFQVVGAYDPNNKEVYPDGNIDTTQDWLNYTINFQNTGTDTARHVYITDTLSSNVDVSTFQLLAYSHPASVQLKKNAVRFNFPNINLPDSNLNEALSHGYVQYKIKLKPNLPIGSQINNTASIYFDFNAPVVTNTTTNTIAVISSVPPPANQPMAIHVYPNPAFGQLTIQLNGLQAEQVCIYNVDGKLISQAKQPANNSLDISHLSKGVYIAEVKVKDAVMKVRWVKM